MSEYEKMKVREIFYGVFLSNNDGDKSPYSTLLYILYSKNVHGNRR